MSITIFIGGWILPMAFSLVGSGIILINDLQDSGSDTFGIGAAFSFMGYLISWGVPWGVYGLYRAIFG